ncbi:DUF4153 domain-containing protein [Phenylobacterium sp.]|uniref:DUF4153 domain-containing protein n=1 Tax=Phenylobacterium sp. TaxID=1871053 RepID=UPI00271EB204|nr:DUF4153 domain-containing protein [Phenylobacterium sp.]MDO8802399.1 DUF4153 domain-containing protein [Phenylobacterium sp.]
MFAGETDQVAASRPIAIARVAIGFAQGLALYGLNEWEKHGLAENIPSPLFCACAMLILFLPVVVLGGLRTLRPRTLIVWGAVTAIVVAGLGAYHGTIAIPDASTEHWPGPPLVIFTAIGLFIAHHLVAGADADRRWIAGYGRYFDQTWKDGVRLALAVLFVGALWLLLWLGGALFDLIGVKWVGETIQKPWFAFPATTTFFALAIHLTDVRASLVRGIRTVALTLLSWLLPVMAVIGAGFLIALPFTGLSLLWDTKSAAGILLSAAAALIVLLNAAYQEGEAEDHPPVALKWAGRVTGVIITPLVAIAAYGLALRIGQYGLTPDRIYGVACTLVAVIYAVGYAASVFWPGPWLKRLEVTNVVTAHVVVAVLLALFSPIANPSRLSVNDQVARLDRGAVTPAKFDYLFLRFEAGKPGMDALKALAARKTGPHAAEIAKRATSALARKARYGEATTSVVERKELVAVAGGGVLPPGFLEQTWKSFEDPLQNCETGRQCDAVVADLDGDTAPEVVVFAMGDRRVYRQDKGVWSRIGTLSGSYCDKDGAALKAGQFAVNADPKPLADVVVAGRRLRVVPDTDKCPDGAAGEAVVVSEIKPPPPETR